MDLVLIRLVDMSFNGMFSDLTAGIQGLLLDVVLIKLVDISFNEMFSDPHRARGGSGFNQIGGHEF